MNTNRMLFCIKKQTLELVPLVFHATFLLLLDSPSILPTDPGFLDKGNAEARRGKPWMLPW